MKKHKTLKLVLGTFIGFAVVTSSLFLLPLKPSQGKSATTKLGSNANTTLLEKKPKVIKGDAFRARLEARRQKNKGLARAMREFAKRGRLPKFEDSMAIQMPGQTAAANLDGAVIRPASYTQDYSDGDSEIYFVTYDGDLDFWNGIVSFHTSYSDDTYSGTFLTPDDDGTGWDVNNEVYYPPDGDDPQCGSSGHECLLSKADPAPKPLSKARVSAAHHGSGKLEASVKSRTAGPPPGFFGWLKHWWGCTSNGCAWTSLTCTGTFRLFCRIGLCTYGAFYCLFH